MTGIIPSLLWKEWHEQRWKIAYMSFLMVSIAAIGLRTQMLPDLTIMGFCVMLGAFLLPIFIGMGLFASERSEGTLSMLTSLPIKSWKIFVIKMIHAIIVFVIPFALTLATVLLLAGNREVDSVTIVRVYLLSYLFSIAFLCWIVGFSITQPTEARSALVSMAVVLAWSLLAIVEDDLLPWRNLSVIITPFGFLANMDHPYRRVEAFSVQTIIVIMLLIQASIRFARMRKEKP